VIRQVHQQEPVRSIRHPCSLLEVNRAWYYASQHENTGRDPNVALRDAIELIVLEFPGYGYRRVTHALKRTGWQVNHKRVLRVMREESLLCQLKQRFVPTTDSHHRYQVYPNLLATMELTAPNQAWVGDITYIRLPSCFVYLACLLDAYSRRCVGWKLSRLIDTNLALGALDMALATRSIQPGLVHHSDRGVQYASTAYVERLVSVQAQISMSALGNPYDNAKAESFFKTLKREEVYLNQYQTFAEAEANIAQFIEDVYNTKRLHSSLGYVPPVEFEEAYFQNSRV
jgi:putative transposase